MKKIAKKRTKKMLKNQFFSKKTRRHKRRALGRL